MVSTVNFTRPSLYEGDSGPSVIDLQNLLKAKGYSVTADGFFGPKTKTAVALFQKQNGLTDDGIVGPKTWEALLRTNNPSPAIRLVDVCKYYNPTQFPHQTQALEWLQSQVPAATITAFAARWRNQV